jgi:hypothetical protein
VPEDYGISDTSGLPPRVPPGIKYAIDPSMLKKPPPLPAELAKVESKEVRDASARTQLISQMHKTAAAPATPESASAFLNQTSVNAPPDSPIVAGPAMPRSVVRPTPPPQLQEAVEPEMTEAEAQAAETGVELQVPLPSPDLSEIQEQEQAPPPVIKPVTKRDRYTCGGCGQPFKYRSQLEKHAAAKHQAAYAAIMAAYPPEAE